MQGYKISTNPADFDFKTIHAFITRSYWAKGIPEATLTRAIKNSLCFGLLTTDGAQIGFARLITDKTTFAYLADVFILEEYRGQGLSKWLMRIVVEHPDLQGLRRILLATRDAQGLYAQFGFEQVQGDNPLMQLWHPDIYQR